MSLTLNQKFLEENISVKKFDNSICQKIMDEIANDENFQNTEGLISKCKNALEFVKETVVRISTTLWDKILAIVNPEKAESLIENEQVLPSKLDLQKEYPNLPFNDNGEIDFDAITLENLREQYPEDDYIIDVNNCEEKQYIAVKNKRRHP